MPLQPQQQSTPQTPNTSPPVDPLTTLMQQTMNVLLGAPDPDVTQSGTSNNGSANTNINQPPQQVPSEPSPLENMPQVVTQMMGQAMDIFLHAAEESEGVQAPSNTSEANSAHGTQPRTLFDVVQTLSTRMHLPASAEESGSTA